MNRLAERRTEPVLVRPPLLCLFAGLLICAVSSSQPQARTSSNRAGAAFDVVLSQFDSAADEILKTTRGEGISLDNVNRMLQLTKARTVEGIPQSDAPLLAYVESRLPESVDSDGRDFISKEHAQATFASVKGLLTQLSKIDAFKLDLTVISIPPGATFTLIPGVGELRPISTNGRLSNVYRGEYHYDVKMQGYKEVAHAYLDLVQWTGNTLVCTLEPGKSSETASAPCSLR